MARKKNSGVDWTTPDSPHFEWLHVQVELLMDLRDELRVISRKLNALECGNFIQIPRTLKAIQKNTTKRKRPAGKPKLRVVA